MKTLIQFVALLFPLLFPFLALAQPPYQRNYISTNVFTGGLIGVGTKTPLATLDVSNVVGSATRPIFHAGTNTSNGLTVSTNGNVSIVGTGYFDSDVTLNTKGLFASGGAALPSITFVGNADSGIYLPTSQALGFATAGAEIIRITSAGNVGIGTTTPTSGRLVIDGGRLTFGTDNTWGIGAVGANRPASIDVGTYVTSPTATIRTNLGTMDVTTNLFALGTRITNGTRRIFVAASAQLTAAAAGTAKVTLYVENTGSATNRLSVAAGPLASLVTVEPLFLPVAPGAIYYFADETSGTGASAAILAETCSVTAF